MLKRFKFYLISGIVLVLLIVCNFVDKPIAKVGEVKDTVMMKLHTKESMAQIDGQTIYFKKIGEGKPPLLMLHGFGGSSDGFSDIYPELARDHTIIAVDILGFGRSSKPIDFEYSFPAQVNLYYKLMKSSIRSVCGARSFNGRRDVTEFSVFISGRSDASHFSRLYRN